jgi:glycerol-3-phosphate acyltransferase PlsY
MGKIDIRDYGSGNAGFTNTARVLGKKAGAIVFFTDLFKLIIAHTVCSLLFDGSGSFVSGSSLLPGLYAGIGTVLGHNFPFYLKFKGGKGIACTLGLMLCVDWKLALITYAVGLVVFIAKKYISLASLTMALVYPILMIVFGFETEPVILMFVLCVLAYIKHKSNIERLIKGNENKFRFGKKTELEKNE